MATQPVPANPLATAQQPESTNPQPSTESAPTPQTTTLPPPILQTRNLHIRPMHPSDAPTMTTAASSPSISKYMTLAFPTPYTLSSATTWITLNTPIVPANNFVICPLSAPATVIGGIGFKPGSDVETHTAEIGYWIGEEWSGRGLMTEAVRAVTGWVFDDDGEGRERGWERLWAGVYEGNGASVRCLEKSGYRREGVLRGHVRKYGVVYDLWVLGIVRGDWLEMKKNEEESKEAGGGE